MTARSRLTLVTVGLALAATTACGSVSPLFCDDKTPCTDPARPFCDLTGEFAESNGIGKTCIANPFDAGPGIVDAGTDATPPNGPIKQVVTSQFNTCILTKTGDVKCWGERLGMGYGPSVIENIGDDETPETIGFVPIGEKVIALSTGGGGAPVTCALTESRRLVCWGATTGAGHSNLTFGPFIGDEETAEEAGPHATPSVAQFSTHTATCFVAATASPSLQCFGSSFPIAQALGTSPTIVPTGGAPEQVFVGIRTACVILNGGSLKCWGDGFPGIPGVPDIESSEVGGNPAIAIGGPVTAVAPGVTHNCALLESGDVRCWGNGEFGDLGNQRTDVIGDNEQPSVSPVVDLGGKKATQICSKCALLEDGTVRCWGRRGNLSFGNTDDVGDDEPAQEVALGGTAESLSCDHGNTCVVMTGGTGVRCWGNASGAAGYGTNEPLGDEPDELPAMLGDVPLGL